MTMMFVGGLILGSLYTPFLVLAIPGPLMVIHWTLKKSADVCCELSYLIIIGLSFALLFYLEYQTTFGYTFFSPYDPFYLAITLPDAIISYVLYYLLLSSFFLFVRGPTTEEKPAITSAYSRIIPSRPRRDLPSYSKYNYYNPILNPDAAQLPPCFRCSGTGQCSKCQGDGPCRVCTTAFDVHCRSCRGSNRCPACTGTGSCSSCGGKGVNTLCI